MPLEQTNGALAITETEIAEVLQQTFFEGRHLQEQDIDKEHFAADCVTVKNLETQSLKNPKRRKRSFSGYYLKRLEYL